MQAISIFFAHNLWEKCSVKAIKTNQRFYLLKYPLVLISKETFAA